MNDNYFIVAKRSIIVRTMQVLLPCMLFFVVENDTVAISCEPHIALTVLQNVIDINSIKLQLSGMLKRICTAIVYINAGNCSNPYHSVVVFENTEHIVVRQRIWIIFIVQIIFVHASFGVIID